MTLIAALAFVVSALLFPLLPDLFGIWKLRANDYLFARRYAWFGCRPGTLSQQVVHLDEDDAARRDIDAERLPSDFHERVINLLNEIDAGPVVFDQIILQSRDPAKVDALVRATKQSGKVYYPIAVRLGISPADRMPGKPEPRRAGFIDRHLWYPEITVPGLPLLAEPHVTTSRRLAEACRGLGNITCRPDADGVYRRFPLLVKCAGGDAYLPGLSLRVVCDFLNVDPSRIKVAFGDHVLLPDARFPDGRRQDVRIPIDNMGRITVNFAAPWDAPELAHSHFTLGGLLSAERDPDLLERYRDAFEGSIVLFSDVTTGSRDTGPVPLDPFYYLSGIHWNIINSVLTGWFLHELPLWAYLAVEILLAGLLGLAGSRLGAVRFSYVAVGLFCFFLALCSWCFFGPGIVMNIVQPATGLVLAFGGILLCKYVFEERERARLRERFGSYLAPAVLNRVLASPSMLDACEKKTVTVLFSDIVGFTPWSAERPADEVRATLNAYFDAMADVVFAHEGTLDKYIGDGLMVFFNDPVPQPDHALRAVRMALAMQRRVGELRSEWEAAGGMSVSVRIGINTGEAVVGNMGSEQRFDYTAVGATVNLAQRLETQAPTGGILVSSSTRKAIGNRIATRSAGTVTVKGLSQPVEAFVVAKDSGNDNKEALPSRG